MRPEDVAILVADPLHENQVCPACQIPIARGQRVGRCPRCRHLQHEDCWEEHGCCNSYLCETSTARLPEELGPVMTIAPEDLEAGSFGPPTYGTSRPLSRLAVASFALGFGGLALFGFPGVAAVICGVLALHATAFKRRYRGANFAVAGIILGLVGVMAWSAAAVLYFGTKAQEAPVRSSVRPVGTSLLVEDLSYTPETIQRAIRANVLVVANQNATSWEGSGIIIARKQGLTYILTNRHVIEGFGGGDRTEIEVTYFNGVRQSGTLEWSGEGGLDLAVLSCSGGVEDGEIALLKADPRLVIGQSVFAIGNPFGLGWSYATGAISAVRQQSWEGESLRIIQTQAPLNPGNSGGGLYDMEGRLIGINTMNADKNRTEGIGFAIAFADVVQVVIDEVGVELDLQGKDDA